VDTTSQIKLDTLVWVALTIAFIIGTSVATGWIARYVARRMKLSRAEQRRIFWGFTFAGPWIVGFLIFVVGPALASFYYSFTDYKLGGTPEFIGLENYQALILGEGSVGRRFHVAMWNSLYYAAIGVPLQLLASLGMAVLLNRNVRGLRVFRLIFYVPVILAGGPALLLAWRYMLTGNGGFINTVLRGLADAFPPFDWLYRSFIYGIEGFNGFYAGVSRGDAVGPLAYVFPALIGVICLLLLWPSDWTEAKRKRARFFAEVIGVIVGALFLSRLLAGADMGPVLGGSPAIVARYLTFGSAISDPTNLEYLDKGFGPEWMNAIWLWFGLIALLGAVSFIRKMDSRLKQILIYGGLVFFNLILISSVIDATRFFNAYSAISAEAGRPTFHFALFRTATAAWPDASRVPLWMTSELWSKPALILITMWSSGAGMLIFLAALKGVPKSLYESAEVDGASNWQKFRNITLPSITPAIFYNLVIGTIAALQTFDSIYQLRAPTNEDSLASAAYFLFQRTFQQLQIGEGAAVSWILVAIVVGLTAMQFRYSGWVNYESEG
jgi:ABC-type sugar transport system permease subunit